MKKLLHILIPFILLSSCSDVPEKESPEILNCVEESGIKICQDTLRLNLPGFVTTGALYYDNYYLFFRDTKDTNERGNANPDKFYRVSKDGKQIKEMSYPEPFESSFGCSFMIRNDSLIAYTQWEDEMYSFNAKTLKWTKVKSSPPIIYEDDEFIVSQICHGEFGGIVSFLDKKNGNTYDGQATCAFTVNKLNDKYYITNFLGHMGHWSEIIQIADPRKLHIRDANPENEWYEYISKLKIGSKSLLDTANLVIHTSFIYQNNLYHIYSNDSVCAIGQLNDSDLSKQLNLNIIPSLQHKLENNNQFLTFYSKNRFDINEEFDFGIMEIIDGELRIHYIE